MRIASLLCSLLVTGCLGPGLTVSVTGEGTVTSDPAGLDCSGDSCGMIVSGRVTLTAVPAEGATFLGWSGACTGSDPCVIEAGNDDLHVDAAFDSLFYPLVVTRTGEGTVTAPGIECGDDCDEIVRHGTAIAVRAVPAPGWSLLALDGPQCVGAQCQFTMTEPSALTAEFGRNNDLVVDVDDDPEIYGGMVISAPSGIQCAAGSSSGCTASLSPATTITLTAVPYAGEVFIGWSGACTTTLASCTLTMDLARQVTAHFGSTTPLLTIQLAGAGQGIVSSSAAGIMCPGGCTQRFGGGSQVTLTATPSMGSTFTGWSGAGADCTTNPTCSFTIYASTTVTATFQPTGP